MNNFIKILSIIHREGWKFSAISLLISIFLATTVPLLSFFGFLIFDEIPDIWTIIGGLIIFSSILIITYRENYLKKDIAKKSIQLNLNS